MKKIKILFCGLLIGISVLSYLIATQKSAATELFLLNVEALSQDENDTNNCVVIDGFCFTNNGAFVPGMKFVE